MPLCLRLLSLLQDLSAAVISAWRKDEMRTKLKAVKKLVDDADRAKKNAMMQQVNKYRPIYFFNLLVYTVLSVVNITNIFHHSQLKMTKMNSGSVLGFVLFSLSLKFM